LTVLTWLGSCRQSPGDKEAAYMVGWVAKIAYCIRAMAILMRGVHGFGYRADLNLQKSF
jgi:hypothetical protein